jgi:GNAT superfamily N-acetyltransferase
MQVPAEILTMGPDDAPRIMAASHLFDGPAQTGATDHFLQRDGHHLLIAYVAGEPVGFVSGMEIEHPDKGCEMLLYELSVEEPFRRNGIGRALVQELGALARGIGCYGMWVVTDEENVAARATYERSGATAEASQVVEVWTFS